VITLTPDHAPDEAIHVWIRQCCSDRRSHAAESVHTDAKALIAWTRICNTHETRIFSDNPHGAEHQTQSND
jgi:hypothetical protein